MSHHHVRPGLAFAAALVAASLSAFAHEAGHAQAGVHAGAHAGSGAKPSRCLEPTPACALTATPAFGADGALWLAYSVGGRVYVSRSADEGRSFGPAVSVTPAPLAVDDNADGRPALAVSAEGVIVVAFATWRDKNWNGAVLHSRSLDGGRTFSPPAPLADSVSQRFATLAFAPDGALWAAWLDKRNLAAAKAAGDDYSGAGLAVAVSRDAGASFGPDRLVMDRTCECCRVSLGFDKDGTALAGWRQIFGVNHRDHEVGRIVADGAGVSGVRVSEDDWAIDACPHHGPSLAVDGRGARHFSWYTGGAKRSGLFYARDAGPDSSFSPPQPIGDAGRAPSHPALLALGDTILRAWKEFDGERTAIMAQWSSDRGDTWSAPAEAAATADASDHPLLIAKNGRAYLSWLTKAEGYRLTPLSPEPER